MSDPVISHNDSWGSPLHAFIPQVEALLFAAAEPLREQEISELIPNLLEHGVSQVMQALEQKYREGGHALTVQRVGGGWRLATHADYADIVQKHLKGKIRGRLTRASLETVSIIAYKQPVSRLEVEQLRGVDSSGTLRHLLERGLIKTTGRADSPGRPLLYSTTEQFLTYFGLDALSELPDPTELLAELDEAERGSVIEVQRGPFAGLDPGVEEEHYRPTEEELREQEENLEEIPDNDDDDGYLDEEEEEEEPNREG